MLKSPIRINSSSLEDEALFISFAKFSIHFVLDEGGLYAEQTSISFEFVKLISTHIVSISPISISVLLLYDIFSDK